MRSSVLEVGLSREVVELGSELPVEVRIKSDIDCRSLKVSLVAIAEGRVRCRYTASRVALGEDEEEEEYVTRRVRFSNEVLRVEDVVAKGKLVRGSRYDVVLKVPKEAPPTYVGKSFSIKWFVEAKIDRRFRKDIVVRKEVVINQLLKEPLSSNEFVGASGKLRVKVVIESLSNSLIKGRLFLRATKDIKYKEIKVGLIRRESIKLREIPDEPGSTYDIECEPYEELVREFVLSRDSVLGTDEWFSKELSIELPKDFKPVSTADFKSEAVLSVKVRKKGFFAGSEEVRVKLL